MQVSAQHDAASPPTVSKRATVSWRERAFLPLATAAEVLGLSPASLYRFEAEGRLVFNRMAGRTLVNVNSLIVLIDSAEEWAPSGRGAAARAKRSERARDRWVP